MPNRQADGLAAPPPSSGREKALPRRSNRKTVVILVSVMAAMAAVGLAYAVWTISFRRSKDPKELTKVEVAAPADLKMLGYLPADTDIVLGLHVAELLQHPQGRDLLTGLRLPVGNAGFEMIEEWTGVRLEDIDHVVIGLLTDWPGWPRTTILVQTRRPADSRKAPEGLQVSGWKKLGARDYRPFRMLGRIGLEGALWLTADDYHVILHSPESSLHQLPDVPNPGIDHLRPEIKKFLRERGKGTQFWLTGDIEDWQKSTLGNLMKWAIPDRIGKPILATRTFGFWFDLGKDLHVSADVLARDAAGATLLEGVLTGWAKGGAFAGNRPEAKELTDELARNLKTEKKETRFTMQTKASAETLKKALAAEEAAPENAKKN